MPLSIRNNLSNIFQLLQTPETLVANVSIAYTAWTTVNSATLNTAKARYAYLSIIASVNDDDNQDVRNNVFFRKTGSGLGINLLTRRASTRTRSGIGMTGSPDQDADMSAFFIELDGNYDFDYYVERVGAPDTEYVEITLLGHSL